MANARDVTLDFNVCFNRIESLRYFTFGTPNPQFWIAGQAVAGNNPVQLDIRFAPQSSATILQATERPHWYVQIALPEKDRDLFISQALTPNIMHVEMHVTFDPSNKPTLTDILFLRQQNTC